MKGQEDSKQNILFPGVTHPRTRNKCGAEMTIKVLKIGEGWVLSVQYCVEDIYVVIKLHVCNTDSSNESAYECDYHEVQW